MSIPGIYSPAFLFDPSALPRSTSLPIQRFEESESGKTPGTRLDNAQLLAKLQEQLFNSNPPGKTMAIPEVPAILRCCGSQPHSFRVEIAIEAFRKLMPTRTPTSVISAGALRGAMPVDEQTIAEAAAKTAFIWADAFLAAGKQDSVPQS